MRGANNMAFSDILSRCMTLVKMLYNFTTYIFEIVFTPMGEVEILGNPIVPLESIWADLTIIELMLGGGVLFFVIYTLIKWFVGIIG